MPTMLLFDMDGVLLQPRGYHRALQKTVQLVGSTLGYQSLHLSQEQIYAFEAAGITSEWDSSAISLGLMLRRAWELEPDLSPPQHLQVRLLDRGTLSPPPWEDFLHQLTTDPVPKGTPRQRATRLLKEGLTVPQRNKIDTLMEQAHQTEGSITFRTFQELVLGSETFQEMYNQDPVLNCRSYLTRYDQPVLSSTQTKLLQAWMENEGQSGAIFTNRPSRPPGDLSGTPEAEIGASLVGLESLPLIGFGQMAWLSKTRGMPIDQCRKPGAPHTLAAMLSALGNSQHAALEAAASLMQGKGERQPWQAVAGMHIYTFEDTPAGLQSILSARDHLLELGIKIKVKAVGIAKDPQKQQAMADLGAHLYPDLPAALEDHLSLLSSL